jgi:hypothetical protein
LKIHIFLALFSKKNKYLYAVFEYVTLLYSASVQYESQFTVSAGAKLAQKRQVYTHKFDYDFVKDEYDVNTPVLVIQANKMMHREAMMPGHTWAKLSEANWEIWDQLSDDVKIAILNAQSQLRSCLPAKPPLCPPDKRLVSLHDVIKACQHLTLDTREDSPDVDAMVCDTAAEEGGQGDITPPSADLLTFATNCQSTDHIPPAHLAKLISDAIINILVKAPINELSMLVLCIIILRLLCI